MSTAASVGSLLGLENIAGSAFDDVLFGNDLANIIQGNDGNDELNGMGAE